MNYRRNLKETYGERLLVGGHRGHASAVRENTIANFEELPKGRILYIEIDVQLTKDRHAVIYHDFELSLQTGLSGFIRDYTLEELQNSFDLCTLEEAVRWCADNRMGAALELKSQPLAMWEDMPYLAEAIVKVLQKYEFFQNCFVFGMDYGTLAAIKEREPRIPIGLIVPFVPKDPVALMKEMQACIYLSFIEGLSPKLVRQLQEAGYIVDGSVVNTEERLEKALELGVDIIESDKPEAIVQLLEEKYAGKLSHTHQVV